MIRLLRHPLFLIGLAVRLALLMTVLPFAAQQWYLPFLMHGVEQFSLDPWSSYLAVGGELLAFPYGYAMLLAFIPPVALAWYVGLPVMAGYGATLLLTDMTVLYAMRRLSNASDRLLLAIYWLSPIILFATYWLGLNDLIPVALLMFGLMALHEGLPQRAAVCAALAVSAKLSMIMAVPFLVVYLFNNKRLRIHLQPFAVVFALLATGLLVLQLLSPGGREMLLGNPELSKVYDIALPIGNELQIYLLPLAYLLVLFGAWRIRRMSFELLLAMLGITFFLVLLLTPASPGWFVWVLPFLVLYQAKSDRIALGLVGVFSLLYIGLGSLQSHLPVLPQADWHAGMRGAELLNLTLRTLSLWQTLLLATGLILVARMLREGIQANEYFRLSRKPFVLGIGGDSGSGKDTLADAVAGLFGTHSVVQVSGDNYHLWDRQKPIWQVMTHLNLRANDLARFSHDVQALANGGTVVSRHYNHDSGKMGKPNILQSNDFIIVSGLHVFSLPILRQSCDLKVFLDMDETLRVHLKMLRDVGKRGHAPEKVKDAIRRREPDAERYVRPQAAQADLVLSLQPMHPDALGQTDAMPKFKLGVRAKQGMYYDSLVRVLVGMCGLHVDIGNESADGAIELTIEGDADAGDIAFAAGELLPQLNELLDIQPDWKSGMIGLMQLIVLLHITQALRKRLL
jgi:uridine kinase